MDTAQTSSTGTTAVHGVKKCVAHVHSYYDSVIRPFLTRNFFQEILGLEGSKISWEKKNVSYDLAQNVGVGGVKNFMGKKTVSYDLAQNFL